MSATSRVSRPGGIVRCGGVARRSGAVASPIEELSQSFNDMPARRAAASALSRTDGSMLSALHDTREFMLSSGSGPGALLAPPALPARPGEETIEFGAGRLPLALTFSCYGK